jgi:hypothetical protein
MLICERYRVNPRLKLFDALMLGLGAAACRDYLDWAAQKINRSPSLFSLTSKIGRGNLLPPGASPDFPPRR